MNKKKKFETIAIHVGNEPDPSTGSISPPIHLLRACLSVIKPRDVETMAVPNPPKTLGIFLLLL